MKDVAHGSSSPFRAFKAVLWAFFGIRKGAASQSDLMALKPWQLILAGIMSAMLLVGMIVALVSVIMTQH